MTNEDITDNKSQDLRITCWYCHQQNVMQSLGASSNVWEEAECKLTSV